MLQKMSLKNFHRILCIFLASVLFTFLFIPPVPILAASEPLASGLIYHIKNKRSGKFMTAAGSAAASNIYQTDFTGNNNQRFKLVRVEGSGTSAYYEMVPMVNTRMRVDVLSGLNQDGTNIRIYNPNSSTAQRFKFIYNNNNNRGTYRIMPKLSTTRVMEVASSSLTSGGNIALKTSGNSQAYQQDWVLEAVDQSGGIIPDMTVYRQETSDTCGPASVRIILKHFGITKSEDTIKIMANMLAPGADYTYVYAQVLVLNNYLPSNIRYKYQSIKNRTADDFIGYLVASMIINYPVEMVFKTTAATYLPYTTPGHYGVAIGVKATGNTIYTLIADPFWTDNSGSHAGIWEIPYETLVSYIRAHSSYIIIPSSVSHVDD